MGNAYFDSASLHLSRGIRHMGNKQKAPGEMQALPQGLPIYFLRCSLLARKKPPTPRLLVLKISDFKVRDQGFEPWTP